jgi:hypothetical protein
VGDLVYRLGHQFPEFTLKVTGDAVEEPDPTDDQTYPCGPNTISRMVVEVEERQPAADTTTDTNMPAAWAVRAMCDDLHKIRDGLAVLGLHAHILDQVSDKLRTMGLEIERVRSDRQYIIGHNDGWAAAMATGLPGDDVDEED